MRFKKVNNKFHQVVKGGDWCYYAAYLRTDLNLSDYNPFNLVFGARLFRDLK